MSEDLLCQRCGTSTSSHCSLADCGDFDCKKRHHDFVISTDKAELRRLQEILLRYQRAPVDSAEESEAGDALLAEMERL